MYMSQQMLVEPGCPRVLLEIGHDIVKPQNHSDNISLLPAATLMSTSTLCPVVYRTERLENRYVSFPDATNQFRRIPKLGKSINIALSLIRIEPLNHVLRLLYPGIL
ncbi:hypothetical protein FRB91_009329 [Serendipita sp. 411]|nr:hypothetical protein FRB91_009329 [Serendipita sp. 411]